MGTLVFTNGCFDLVHPGHIDFLERARALGDRLIVGLNSDGSTTAIKGPGRPLVPQEDRAAVLRGLRSVDEVIIFDEPTPANIIERLEPDVLVKGGDWPASQIIGADLVQRRGGRVLSLPLKPNYSTSALARRICAAGETMPSGCAHPPLECEGTGDERSLEEHLSMIQALRQESMPVIRKASSMILDVLQRKNKIMLCGNGGSASDAQHIAAEFVGRYENEREGLPAIALTTNSSVLTAVSNDYGYDRVFARQVEALGRSGDLLIALSTSGNSPNVLEAVMTARRLGCGTIGMTGTAGKRLAALCDVAIMVPSTRTSRVQEGHAIVGHLWCEMLERALAEMTS